MTKTKYTSLDEIKTCPVCDERIHTATIAEDGSPDVEFWCGTLIGHDPLTDAAGESSVAWACDED